MMRSNVLLQVLKPESTDTVLTLTSGGCNALNLLLHGAGHVRILSAPRNSDRTLCLVVLMLSKCYPVIGHAVLRS